MATQISNKSNIANNLWVQMAALAFLGAFKCNFFRDIACPTLVGIESHNAQNALVFTPEDALDNGLLVCPEFVDFPPGEAALTEVLKDSVHCQIMSRN